MKNHDQRIQWWRDAKFGMFIHWGVYSLPGGDWKGKKLSGYAEHLMRKEKISRAEYLALAHQFNPRKFNAEEWVTHAQRAGMKYFVITAKHHDGFALYNSAVSDFDIIDQTPFKRDPIAELAAACKKLGMKFGFYYSHAFDWEHSDAPGNDWEYSNPGGDKLLGGAAWYDTHPEWLPKAVNYVDTKAIPQIKELLVKYDPDILWFDTPHKLPLSENIRILKAIRETDPDVVINGRLVRTEMASLGDYRNTADRPAEFFPVEGDWEAIPTTNESYGYHQYDSSHKPVSHFIRLLANAVSRGGNLLMNIGPRGDGSFDSKDLANGCHRVEVEYRISIRFRPSQFPGKTTIGCHLAWKQYVFIPIATKFDHVFVTGEFCERRNLHNPAGAMIIFRIHFILPIFMSCKPFNVFLEPDFDGRKRLLIHRR